VRAEEYDWKIYHIIAETKGCTIGEISERCGFSDEVVQESLDRLRSSLLIRRQGEKFRVCSIEEFMFSNQMKHDPCSDIVIEDGVIRVKSPAMRKEGEGRQDPGAPRVP
jgi:hypothetical protein